MNIAIKNLLSLFVMSFISICALSAHAERYHIIAGSSDKGLHEIEKQNVHLGFSSILNEVLLTEDIRCTIKSYENIDELVTAMQKKEINAFFGSAIEYLDLEPYLIDTHLATAYFDNKLTSSVFLIVRKDSSYHKLEDLKGKTLALKKWYVGVGDISSYYLDTKLMEKQLPVTEHYFSEVLKAETTNRAIVDLFFNKVDAALVTEHQFNVATSLNPQLKKDTRILMASEPYIMLLVAMGKHTPSEFVQPIINSFLETANNPKGRAVLRLMKIERLGKVEVGMLDNVRELMHRHKTLKAKRAIK